MAISAAITAVASVASAGISYVNGKKSLKAQKSAQAQAEKQAESTAQDADRAANRANQRRPDIIGMLGDNLSNNSLGFGSTFLTGASGSPISSTAVGKNTLLGQ